MVSGVLNIPLLWHIKFHFRAYETRPITMHSYNMNFNFNQQCHACNMSPFTLWK